MILWPEKRKFLREKPAFGSGIITAAAYVPCLDVDEILRTVTVHNYTEDPLYRAFGRNTEPTFEEYEEFLESRCFPRTRDKMKLQLKELDIPFYDPEMIIRKTEGRMAGDDFWVRMER